jgi:hypothetical protein
VEGAHSELKYAAAHSHKHGELQGTEARSYPRVATQPAQGYGRSLAVPILSMVQ